MKCPNCGCDLPENGQKFYSKSWFIILMLLLLFPIGLVLMWRYMKFNKPCRIVVTALCFFFLLIFALGYTADDSVFIDELRSDIATLESEKEALIEENKELKNEIETLKEKAKSEEEVEVNSSTKSNSNKNASSKNDKKDKVPSNAPSKIDLISYAQVVLEDFYPSPKFPAGKDSYNCPGTGLRYKIEGQISVDGKSAYQNFYVIIEFVNDTYTEYDLVLAQVGKEVLYKR